MSTCRDARRTAAAEEREPLDTEQHAELAQHLQACEACSQFVAEQREVRACLESRPEAPVPSGFAARLRTRLANEEADSSDGWLGLANWQRWTQLTVPAAIGLFVVVALTGGGSTTTGSSGTATETGQAVVAYVTATDNDTTASQWLRSDVTDEDLVASMVGVATTASRGVEGSNGK